MPQNADGLFTRWRKRREELEEPRAPAAAPLSLRVPEVPRHLGRPKGERDVKDAEAEAAHLRQQLEQKDQVCCAATSVGPEDPVPKASPVCLR